MAKGNGKGQQPPGTKQGPMAPPFPVKGKTPPGGTAPGKGPGNTGVHPPPPKKKKGK